MINLGRNVGEEGEVFFKAFILQQMDLGNTIHPFGKIVSIDFGPALSIPKWLPKYNKLLAAKDYVSLKSIFPKAPGGYKADIGINGVNYSLKYKGGAKSAIVNHTSRRGFLRICDHLGLDIKTLDNIINEYWIKREAGLITEDVSNSHPESPFKNHENYLDSILKYFLFDGTGSKDSEFKADKVIVFSDPLDSSTYNILSKDDVVNHIWDSLVFSLRSKKGMPSNYSSEVDGDLTPWIRYRPGDENPKGALHIRT
ncbi:MAG: hypothetical protein WC087_02640 [Candidatus Paceibacterota bacterium]